MGSEAGPMEENMEEEKGATPQEDQSQKKRAAAVAIGAAVLAGLGLAAYLAVGLPSSQPAMDGNADTAVEDPFETTVRGVIRETVDLGSGVATVPDGLTPVMWRTSGEEDDYATAEIEDGSEMVLHGRFNDGLVYDTLFFSCSVAPDGSIYIFGIDRYSSDEDGHTALRDYLPEGFKHVERWMTTNLSDDERIEGCDFEVPLRVIPAEDVTPEIAKDALDEISEAVSRCDGVDGDKVIATATEYLSKAPQVGEQASEQAEAAEGEAEKAAAKADSSSGSKSQSGSSSSGSSSNSGSNSGSSSSGSNSGSSKPAHKHTPVEVTQTIHHDAVTHQEPVYNTVEVPYWQFAADGYKAYSDADRRQHAIWLHSQGLGSNYSVKYEYRQELTGYQTVVDQAAWDEVVVVGHKCSSCGASL